MTMHRILFATIIAFAAVSSGCSGSSSYVPPSGSPGPDARPNFSSYAPHAATEVDALRDAPAEQRNEFCKNYCATELSWPAGEFVKSSIETFFQTPEATDLRCDYSEVTENIGGSEMHAGSWIAEQCAKRGASHCYWSINYGKRHAGRVACIRPVFAR